MFFKKLYLILILFACDSVSPGWIGMKLTVLKSVSSLLSAGVVLYEEATKCTADTVLFFTLVCEIYLLANSTVCDFKCVWQM